MTLEVAVLTGGAPLLHALRAIGDHFTFVERVSDRTSLVVTDDASAAPEGAAVIHLSNERRETSRRVFTVSPALFEADPRPFLSMAAEIVLLRGEVDTARDVEMLMRDADLDSACRHVAVTAAERAGFTAATLLIHDTEVERYVPAYTNEPNFTPSGDYLPGIAPDILQEAIGHPMHFALRQMKGGVVAVLPLLVGDDLVGVVKLSGAREAETTLMEKAALYLRGITPVILRLHQLSKSKDLALRDDLTKAFNRRFFETHLDEEVERAKRYGAIVSIIFLDLDDLKLVNNKYGHVAGSRLLQEVARRILGAVRAIDKVVRFGGDEFCIILPETDPDQAVNVASRIRSALSQRPFTLEAGAQTTMTASFGIASYPLHARSKDELVRQADAAMYAVKSSSKNAISIATPTAERPSSPQPLKASQV